MKTSSLTPLAPGEHETATISAPFTLDPLAELPLGSQADLDHAFQVARTAQSDWQSIPVSDRVSIVRRFRDLLLERTESVLDVLKKANREVALAVLKRFKPGGGGR